MSSRLGQRLEILIKALSTPVGWDNYVIIYKCFGPRQSSADHGHLLNSHEGGLVEQVPATILTINTGECGMEGIMPLGNDSYLFVSTQKLS
jgi:hypothetical protein